MTTPLPNPFLAPARIEPSRFVLDEDRFTRDITIFLPPDDPARMLLSEEFAPIRQAIAGRR